MVLLGIPPFPSLQDLGDDAALPPLLVDFLCHLFGDGFLLVVVVEDARAVLGSAVWTLGVEGCGVVHAVEEFEELAVGDLGWVVVELDGFGVASTSTANTSVAWALGIASNIANTRIVQSATSEALAEHVLDSPKATCSQSGFSSICWDLNDTTSSSWAETERSRHAERAKQRSDETRHGDSGIGIVEHDSEEHDGRYV